MTTKQQENEASLSYPVAVATRMLKTQSDGLLKKALSGIKRKDGEDFVGVSKLFVEAVDELEKKYQEEYGMPVPKADLDEAGSITETPDGHLPFGIAKIRNFSIIELEETEGFIVGELRSSAALFSRIGGGEGAVLEDALPMLEDAAKSYDYLLAEAPDTQAAEIAKVLDAKGLIERKPLSSTDFVELMYDAIKSSPSATDDYVLEIGAKPTKTALKKMSFEELAELSDRLNLGTMKPFVEAGYRVEVSDTAVIGRKVELDEVLAHPAISEKSKANILEDHNKLNEFANQLMSLSNKDRNEAIALTTEIKALNKKYEAASSKIDLFGYASDNSEYGFIDYRTKKTLVCDNPPENASKPTLNKRRVANREVAKELAEELGLKYEVSVAASLYGKEERLKDAVSIITAQIDIRGDSIEEKNSIKQLKGKDLFATLGQKSKAPAKRPK